ncbi:uncharacterized protein LOC105847729 isoform X1 [Hydra vulgaris]|uniref:uncharacterized protein LOC105847729 isoform X1 n=2 Tax=Hydra vulgaris TaxID=6087 RepID=UPI0032EA01E4
MIKHKIYIWIFVHFLNNATIEMFEMKDVFAIEKNNLIAVFETFPNEYEISFELYLTNFINQWTSVLHFTIGDDKSKYGDRIFSFYFFNNFPEISSSINGNYYVKVLSSPLNLMEWNKFFISHSLLNGIYTYVVKMDDTVIITLQNTNAQPFEYVRLYTSNPWYYAQPGYIRNLVVSNVNTMPFFTVNSELVLHQGNYLTTIKKLPKEYEITFEAYFTSYLTNAWSDVIAFYDNGERVFVITIYNTILYACASVNGKVGYYIDVKTYNLNEWIKFSVKQSFINGNYNHVVQIAGIIVDELQNTAAKVFQNVDVYAPAYNAQPGFLKNLVVINACPICDLIPMLSNNSYEGAIYLLVNITTNPECLSYLQNVNIYLQPESLLIFKRFVWFGSSMNVSNVQKNGKSFIINVGSLTKNLYATFSIIFSYESVPKKKSNVSIIAGYSWNYFCEDPGVKYKNQTIMILLNRPIPPVNKIHPTWNYEQPDIYTSLMYETRQFVCQIIQKRQSSPCYQREISSGVINFLPIQVIEVIGYDPNTTLIYGLTTRNNLIEVDISTRKPFVITKERCLNVPLCEKFLSRK